MRLRYNDGGEFYSCTTHLSLVTTPSNRLRASVRPAAARQARARSPSTAPGRRREPRCRIRLRRAGRGTAASSSNNRQREPPGPPRSTALGPTPHRLQARAVAIPRSKPRTKLACIDARSRAPRLTARPFIVLPARRSDVLPLQHVHHRPYSSIPAPHEGSPRVQGRLGGLDCANIRTRSVAAVSGAITGRPCTVDIDRRCLLADVPVAWGVDGIGTRLAAGRHNGREPA